VRQAFAHEAVLVTEPDADVRAPGAAVTVALCGHWDHEPFAIAPAIAPAILTIGGGSYGVLYMVAGLCAIIGAAAILPVRRVR